ncbi:MAG: biopolymer transporter ExbD [Bacteroidetes bacterium]|nr:biopolymer transporter ExbD [Bacteroidota bacterium]
MSGASGGLAAPVRVKRGKLSKRKKGKRVGFTLDMTPLVDITFLLLTFFMFTTTMAAPQVMEMSIPPESVPIEVKENELLTLRLRNDGKLFWNMANDEPKPVSIKDVRKIAERTACC